MIREDFKIASDQTTHTEDDHGMDKTIEVGQDMIPVIELATGIIQEVVRDMGDQIITIIEGKTLEVKIMIETGVSHTKDRTKIEGTAEILVTVGQGQVHGLLQIQIGLDALSVGNMIILLGIVQIGKQAGNQNRYNKCSIWM